MKFLIILAVLLLAFAGFSRLTNSRNVVSSSSTGSTVGKPDLSTSDPTGLPRLIDFGSTSCLPCKMMVPVLDELSTEYKKKLSVEFINIYEDKESARQYKIRAIPTQVFIDRSGKEFFRHMGYYSK
ncbi:MAG: thioredoxin family protein, partial [Armatimonadota bacterium]